MITLTDDYADADEPTCKYCGKSVKQIIPEGTPYWKCTGKHGRLNVSEIIGIEPGKIPESEKVNS